MTDRWKYFIEFQGQKHPLESGDHVVGRSRKCDLSIAEPSASRKHAVLTPGEGLVKLKDLGSSNGTFINGNRVEGTGMLRNDDILGLGDAEIKIVIEQPVDLATVRLPTDDLAVADADVGEATTFLQAASVQLAQDAIGDPQGTGEQAPAPPPAGGHMAPPPVSSGQHMAPPALSSGQHMMPPLPEPPASATAAPAGGDPLSTTRLETMDLPIGGPPVSEPENPLATTVFQATGEAASDPLLTARFDAGSLNSPASPEAVPEEIDPRMTARIDTGTFQPIPKPPPSSPEAQALQTSRLSPEQLRAVQEQLNLDNPALKTSAAESPTIDTAIKIPAIETPAVETPAVSAPPEFLTSEPAATELEAPRPEIESSPPIAPPAFDIPTTEPEPLPALEALPELDPPAVAIPSAFEAPNLGVPEISPAAGFEPPQLEMPEVELPPEMMQPVAQAPVPGNSDFAEPPSFEASAATPSFDLPTMDLPTFEAPESAPAASAFDTPSLAGQDTGLPTFEAPDFSSTPMDLPPLESATAPTSAQPEPENASAPPLAAAAAPAFQQAETPLPSIAPPPPPVAPSSFDQGAYVPPPAAPATPPLDVPVPSSSVPDIRDLAAQQAVGDGDNEMLSSLDGFDTTLGPGSALPASMQRAQENMARSQPPEVVETEPNPYTSPVATKPPASFLKRAMALFIDSLWMTVLMMGVVGITTLMPDLLPADVAGLPTVSILTLGVGAFIFLVMLIGWSVWGSTPGKRLMGLVICDAQGKAGIGFFRAVLRLLGYFLSNLTLGIGFLLALGKSGKALHDHLAGTYVRER